jgi:hypothetical protein
MSIYSNDPDLEKFQLVDETGTKFASINTDGSINVQVGGIVTPPAGTTVSVSQFGSVSSTTGIDTFYTVTNGKTLTLQRFTGGAEPHQSGSIVELFHDTNGNLSVLNRIETVFVNGDSAQVGINQSIIGNGVGRILMRRRTYTASSREVWGRWEGFEI